MASPPALPTTMKAWSFPSNKGGIISNLKLVPDVPFPVAKDPSTQHIVQIHAACLNPVDLKAADAMPMFLLPKLAIPGTDFVGTIVTPATKSNLKAGQLIFGCTGQPLFAGGALAEYAFVKDVQVVPVPEGVNQSDAATIGVAGTTAYGSIVPHVKKGDRVFINGGSGGVGVFGIQIAKVLGCHVTTTCSTPNVELCKSLGADEVIDYKKGSVLEALKKRPAFDHVVDVVGSDYQLYWKAHEYLEKGGKYIFVAGGPSLRFIKYALTVLLLPAFLGGGKRQNVFFTDVITKEELTPLGAWMKEGKVKAAFDETFSFEEVPAAFRRLQTGRARGKVFVNVAARA